MDLNIKYGLVYCNMVQYIVSPILLYERDLVLSDSERIVYGEESSWRKALRNVYSKPDPVGHDDENGENRGCEFSQESLDE